MGWRRIPPRLGMLWLVCLALPARCAGAAAPAGGGDERVLFLGSVITVLPDASVRVRETIRVRAAGREIRRGIYRDYPNRFRSPEGVSFDAPITVLEVLRDGDATPWRTAEAGDCLRVYVGDEDALLEPGEHTFVIAARAERQLGFFEDHDELQWGVTGNGWSLPIEAAEARILLPPGVTGASIEAATGARGAGGRDATVAWIGAREALLRATRPLEPGEGLTATVRWPKGHVREPQRTSLSRWYLRGVGPGALTGFAGLLLVLTYYAVAAREIARRRQSEESAPQGAVPEGLSPAELRLERDGSAGVRALTSTLVGMALAGRLAIEERDGAYALVRDAGGGEAPPPEELRVLRDLRLDAGGRLELHRASQRRVGGALTSLENFLRVVQERRHLRRNREILGLGVAISLIVVGAAATLQPGLATVPGVALALSLVLWTMVVGLLTLQVLLRWQDAAHLRGRPAARASATAITLFAVPFLAAEYLGLSLLVLKASAAFAVTLVLVALVNLGFHWLSRRLDAAARRVHERIAGLAAHLAGAPPGGAGGPGADPKREEYERLLPYAVALGVEEPWTLRFARGGDGAGRGWDYRPGWYRRVPPADLTPAAFAAAVGTGLCEAVASAAGETPAAAGRR